MRLFAIVVCAAALAVPAVAGDLLSSGANEAFLGANAKKAGVTALPGIQYEVLKRGDGAQPTRRDCVTVYYKGSLISGKVFDETKPGEPATFPVGALIPGWISALELMHVGEKWRLVIPAWLAYGRAGAGQGVIPPNQTLVFEVELLKVFAPGPAGCQ